MMHQHIINIKTYLLEPGSYYTGLCRHMGIVAFYAVLLIGIYHCLPTYFNTYSESYFLWQRLLGRSFIVLLCFHLFTVVYLKKEAACTFLYSYFFSSGSAYNLAIFRIFMMAFLLTSYDWAFYDLSKWAAMPDASRVSLPYMGWLVQNIPITPDLYLWAVRLGKICVWLALFGFMTRWALLLLIPLSLYVWGVPVFFGKMAHNHILVWIPSILAFSRCADVLSVDSLIKKMTGKQPEINPHHAYGLPFKFTWLLFGCIYFFAGVGKLWISGFDWALSDSMIHQIQLEWVEHYYWLPAFRIDHYPWLCKLLGLGVIFMELLYPLLVLAPKTRFFAALGGLSLHQGAGYFMKIGFEDLQRAYVSYVNWQFIYDWLDKRTGMGKWVKKISGFFHRFITKPSPQAPLINTKPLLFTGFLLLGMNTLCGIFDIHSFPFSAYPNYARLVPGTVQTIHFELKDKNGQLINVDKEAQKINFRKENITYFEREIVAALETPDNKLAKKRVRDYWNLWQHQVPALRQAHDVSVYLEKRSLTPEKWDSLIWKARIHQMVNMPLEFKESDNFGRNESMHDKIPQPYCPDQNPTIEQWKIFTKTGAKPPKNESQVFDMFGNPGLETNTGWMSIVAAIHSQLKGQNMFENQVLVQQLVDEVAPSFSREIGFYMKGKKEGAKFFEDVQQWACQHPEEVQLAEAFYCEQYEAWSNKRAKNADN